MPCSIPRLSLLPALLLLPLALAACGGGDGALLDGATFEVNRGQGQPEEVGSYGDVTDAVGFRVGLPSELPLELTVQRVLATPEGTGKLGPLLQFFLDAEGTTADSTLTVTRSPHGPREVAPVAVTEEVEGYFTASGDDMVLEWEACERGYAYQAPAGLDSADVLSVARAFIDACEE